MNMKGTTMKRYLLPLALLLSLSLLAACTALPAPRASIANPASENCVARGGKLEIRQGEGGETGYCVFADGSECEEWALLRGQCSPGQSPAAFADPFAYCAVVGTIDAPDSRYNGEQPPAAVIAGLRAAFDTPADTPDDAFKNGTFWRCANGQVKACFVGANLPCEEKADLSETPNQGTVTFCRENPNSDGAPAAATGRATVFAWSCANGVPVKGQQLTQADAQGFIADFWYVIEPPTAATATPVGAYVPLPADACTALKTAAENALGVPFTMAEAPFLNYITQQGGRGCQLTATGTGVNFSSPAGVVDALRAAFSGWQEDMQYAADGPTGTDIGMTRDTGLLLIQAGWQPAPAAHCPEDQPISACQLTPEQRLYTVTVQAATK